MSQALHLAEQAIEAFAESQAEGGLEQGAYPSRSDNVIATFSLLWVGMLSDWSMVSKPSRSSDSLIVSGGFVKNVFQRTKV